MYQQISAHNFFSLLQVVFVKFEVKVGIFEIVTQVLLVIYLSHLLTYFQYYFALHLISLLVIKRFIKEGHLAT